MRVLCEGSQDAPSDDSRFGYTPNYLPVQVVADGGGVTGNQGGVTGNQLLDVLLTGLDAGGQKLVGRPIGALDHSPLSTRAVRAAFSAVAT